MFISGGAAGWKVGCSPLVGGQGCSDPFEKDVHTRIMDAGIFDNYPNQAAALAYLNGQFMLRKEHSKKIDVMKKALKNLQMSGVTRRFMKVPTKLLPKDKYNSEQELGRAARVLSEMKRFKFELILLKKNCLDDAQSVKCKKKEEFVYYSDKIKDMINLIVDMEGLKNKLNETNLEINKSSGSFGSTSSVLENKRIMRRRKESGKVESRKTFQRSVESLRKFLPKYTSKIFEDVFEVVEIRVEVKANHHGAKRPNNPVQVAVKHLELEDEFVVESLEDGEQQFDHEIGEDDELDVFVEGDEPVDDINNNEPQSKKKYQHYRLEKSIKLKEEQLQGADFTNLEFVKQDLKSLNLMKDMNALGVDLAKMIRAKMSEWELEKSSAVYEAENEHDEEEANEAEEVVSEASHEETESGGKDITVEEEGSNDASDDKKKMRKSYKKSITEVLADNGNRMKKKKLKDKIVRLSSQYDEREDEVRKVMFEKYLLKVKNVVVGEKYVVVVE